MDTVANEIMSHLFIEEMRQSMLEIDESIFVDERMMHYNFRPITYTLCSILIISLPITLNDLQCCTNNIYINIVHIFYLSLNLLMMLLLIPLYAMCVPESIDSIIANGNKSLNRRPPLCDEWRLATIVIGVKRARTPSKSQHEYNGKSQSTNNALNGQNEVNADNHSMPSDVMVTCGSIIYSVDAIYNRFFNIRNTPLDATEAINFDTKIFDAIAIPFAGVFLISSNIILLSSYMLCDSRSDTGDTVMEHMVSNLTLLIFFAELLVSYTLFPSISLHFNQIKDEKHPLKRYSEKRDGGRCQKYIATTERALQHNTDRVLVQYTMSQIAVYILSTVLSIILWTTYYILNGNGLWEAPTFYVLLFFLIIYTVIAIHLVFRLLVLYEYPLLIVDQFSRALQMRNSSELIVYWDLRRFYIDFVLSAFHCLFQQIWTFLFCVLSLVLIVLYFIATRTSEGNASYLPIFAVTVYLMVFVLFAVHWTSRTIEIQREHAIMLNVERIGVKQKLCSGVIHKDRHRSIIQKSEELCSLIGHMQSVVKEEREYQIGGMNINNTNSVLLRSVVTVFVSVVLSYLI